MHDATPGGHPVHRARPDRHGGAETVAMHNFAVEQVGDGGEPNMRVRPHVDAVAGLEHCRAEMVEEDERPDHARLPRRQRAMHLEAAEIDRARHDQLLDGVARLGIAEVGVLAGEKAHDLVGRRTTDDRGRKKLPLFRYLSSVVRPPSSVSTHSLRAGYRLRQVTIALAANRARRQRRGFALATRSAMKRGWAKAATWCSGVQYLVVKLPA